MLPLAPITCREHLPCLSPTRDLQISELPKNHSFLHAHKDRWLLGFGVLLTYFSLFSTTCG